MNHDRLRESAGIGLRYRLPFVDRALLLGAAARCGSVMGVRGSIAGVGEF
jgi:hypothetical protein